MADVVWSNVEGNIVKDAETKSLDNGGEMVRFSIASSVYCNNEKKCSVKFFNCVAFGFAANVAKSFNKGDKVLALVSQEMREYKSSKTGSIEKADVMVVKMCKRLWKKKGAGDSDSDDSGGYPDSGDEETNRLRNETSSFFGSDNDDDDKMPF